MNKELRSGLCIAHRNIQTEMLKSGLNSELRLHLSQVDLEDLPQALNTRPFDVLIMDYDLFRELNESRTVVQKCNATQLPVVLINCEKPLNIDTLIPWSHLAGVFYATDLVDTLYKGIQLVLEGKHWLNRSVSQSLLVRYREQYKVESPLQDGLLTAREWQILKLIGKGYSNGDISQHIYVSENTVKTHIYHIYRKIKVKNRVGAILWLENIAEPLEPMQSASSH
ncbi:response regulator transcription factor [Vibrio maerlii]|uniref:response regulator transcription factor n=1 Tax=Vibrio maerlii TaxID=2231648 RepID=UPI0013DFBC5A|nr:response regulator transcription factor [Vibrio maerlii]